MTVNVVGSGLFHWMDVSNSVSLGAWDVTVKINAALVAINNKRAIVQDCQLFLCY
jgi:hypothetical protein